MVNPAFPPRQLVGVFSLELARQYGYLYQNTNKDFVILHDLQGYDEISLTGPFKIYTNNGEKILEPIDLGLPQVSAAELKGGETIEESARIFLDILEGKGTEAQNSVVIANAGMAIYAGQQLKGILDSIDMAREALVSGRALSTFKRFLNK
jgi:anthranilate phosphoribosyltransferase